MRPVVLSIAGLDPGGGAGLIADVKTCEAHGCWPTGVATALTAQTVDRVRSVHPVPAASLVEQIEAVLDDFEVAAVKIGLLPTRESVLAVGGVLAQRRFPIVLDPVCRSTSGTRFLDEAALDALRTVLLPIVYLATPNVEETRILAGPGCQTIEDCAALLLDRGLRHLLVTAGAGNGTTCEDRLFASAGVRVVRHGSIATDRIHGTGCVHSSSIAAHLAHGATLLDAVTQAGRWMEHVLELALPFGCGGAPDAGGRRFAAVAGSSSEQRS